MNKFLKLTLLSCLIIGNLVSCIEPAGIKYEQDLLKEQENKKDVTLETPVTPLPTFNIDVEKNDSDSLVISIEKSSASNMQIKKGVQKDSEFATKLRTIKSDEKGQFTHILMGTKQSTDLADIVGTDTYYSTALKNNQTGKLTDVGLFSKDPYLRAAYIGKNQSYIIRDPRAANFQYQTYAYMEQKLNNKDYFAIESFGKLADKSIIPNGGKNTFLGYATGVYFKNNQKYYIKAGISIEIDYSGSEDAKLAISSLTKYKVNADNSLSESENFNELDLTQFYAVLEATNGEQKFDKINKKLAYSQKEFPAIGVNFGAGVDRIILGLAANLYGVDTQALEIGGVFSIRTSNSNNYLIAGFSAKLPPKVNPQKFLQDSFVKEYDDKINQVVGTKLKDYNPTLVSVYTGSDKKPVYFESKVVGKSTNFLSALYRNSQRKFEGAMVGKRINTPQLVSVFGETLNNSTPRKNLLIVNNKFNYSFGIMSDVGVYSGISALSSAYTPDKNAVVPYVIRDPNTLGWNYQTILHIGQVRVQDNFEVYQSFGVRSKDYQVPTSGKKSYKGYLQGKYFSLETNSEQIRNSNVRAKIKNTPTQVFGSGANADDKERFFLPDALGVHKNKSLFEIYTKAIMTQIVANKPLDEVFTLDGLIEIVKTVPKESVTQEFIAEVKIIVNFDNKTVKLNSLNTQAFYLQSDGTFKDAGLKNNLDLKENTNPISWSNKETLAKGSLKSGFTNNEISTQLRFYGDSAQEVGGVFGTNTQIEGSFFVGAFGAKLE